MSYDVYVIITLGRENASTVRTVFFGLRCVPTLHLPTAQTSGVTALASSSVGAGTGTSMVFCGE